MDNNLIQTDLPAGNYELEIIDGDGCEYAESFTLLEPEELLINELVTHPECFELNGDISIEPLGGAEPYEIIWSDGLAANNELEASDITPGDYSVSVTDANDCEVTLDFTINEPANLDVSCTSTNILCFGESNGSIDCTVNGTEPYTVTWSGPIVLDNNLSQSNLPQGEYTLDVSDGEGCSYLETITITEESELMVIETVTQPSCFGEFGEIEINVVGGVEEYNITWSSAGTDGQTLLTDLTEGIYTVTVLDQNDCEVQEDYGITIPIEIIISETLEQPSCAGELGSISLDISGGTEPLTIVWEDLDEDGQTELENLSAGSYTVTVTDGNNCVAEETYTIDTILEIEVESTSSQPLCFSAVGAIDLVISGGTSGDGTYGILWTGVDAPNQASVNNLLPGDYSVTITDDNGCDYQEDFTINEPYELELLAEIGHVLCNAENTGFINITIDNLTGEGTYEWENEDSTFSSENQDILDLEAGVYTLSVIDELGCEAIESFQVLEPEELTIQTAALSNVTCTGETDGVIDISVLGGTAEYSYLWSAPGFSEVTEDIGELSPGEYTVTVTDANNCQTAETFTIEEGAVISAEITTIDSSCGNNDGSASAVITSDNGIQSTIWLDSNNNEISDSDSVDELSAGSYSLTVTDTSDCTETFEFSISDTDGPTLTFESSDVTCFGQNNGTITLTATGGTEPLLLEWTNGPQPIENNEYAPENLIPGEYTASVTDALGCNSTEVITIDENTEILVEETVIHVLCSGESTGAISLEIIGGTEPYSINWLELGITDEIEVADLSAGQYTVQVSDAQDCETELTIEIEESTQVELNETITHPEWADELGAISIEIAGGEEPYFIIWQGLDENGQTQISDLEPNTYMVSITDANNCVTEESYTINSVSEITLESTVIQPECFDTTGSIDLIISGGTTVDDTYTIVWTGVNAPNQTAVNNLNPGNYTVEITDDNGCSITEEYTVEEPYNLEVTSETGNVLCNGGNTLIQLDLLQSVSCSGAADGAIDVTVSGGTIEYMYTWEGTSFSADTEDISNLAPGEYTLTVTDQNSCLETAQFTVEEGAVIEAEILVEQATCGNGDGSASADITSDNEIISTEWYTAEDEFISDELSAENLSAGGYYLEITDVNGCMKTFNFSVSDANGPSIDFETSNITCFGDNNGAIDLIASGGTEPYVLSWTSGPQEINDDEYSPSALMPGDYTAQVTDDTGCIASEVISITEPELLTVSGSTTNVSCNSAETGSISIEISGGTEEYSINWVELAVFDQTEVNNLSSGTYTVQISDVNDCTAEEVYTITEETEIILTFDYESNLCLEDEITDIDLSISGGVPGYTVSWTGDLEADTEDLLNVGIGTYAVTVTDQNDCAVMETLEILLNPQIEISINPTSPTCGQENGSLEADVSGGTADFDYFWYNTSGGTPVLIAQTLEVENLGVGSYIFEVIDSAGCMESQSINLSSDEGELTSEVSNILCAGDLTGAIDISVSGLEEPLVYSWTGPNGYVNNTEDIETLAAGSYVIEVTDANDCIIIETFEITEPEALHVDLEIMNDCFGPENTGAIDISISGGLEPYTVSWAGEEFSSSDEDISELEAGCYLLTVTDGNDCVFEIEACVLATPEITASAEITNNFCFNDADGVIDITVEGGIPEFTYSWTNQDDEEISIEEDLENLENGDYTVTITDMGGCTAQQVFSISSNPEIEAEIEVSPIVCPGEDNACIEIIYSGGQGDLSLNWTSTLGFESESDLICDLVPATYFYAVIDELGCVLTDSVIIEDPLPLSLNETITNAQCFQSEDGVIQLNPAGGYTPYSAAWSYNDTPFSIDLDINELDTGAYTVILTDSLGCAITDVFTISEPEQIEVTVNALINATCQTSLDGGAEITVSGGTPDYEYSWILGDTEASAQQNPDNLGVGTYDLVITDANSCSLELNEIVINPLGTVNVEVPDSVSWCFTENVQSIEAILADAPNFYWQNENQETISNTTEALYTNSPGEYELVFFGEDGPCVITDTTIVTIYELPYADAGEDQNTFFENEILLGGSPVTDLTNTVTWSNGELLNDSALFEPTYIVVNEEQQFTLTVTSPEGCISSDSVIITMFPELVVNTGFTPNDDGTNDVWTLGNYQNYPNIEVFVFNRWGEELFYSRGYDQPWDGTLNGNKLPIGTYYYVIVIDEPDLKQQLDGPVTILR